MNITTVSPLSIILHSHGVLFHCFFFFFWSLLRGRVSVRCSWFIVPVPKARMSPLAGREESECVQSPILAILVTDSPFLINILKSNQFVHINPQLFFSYLYLSLLSLISLFLARYVTLFFPLAVLVLSLHFTKILVLTFWGS